jgi:CP family cyanate transporter-like MFS transporter
VSAPRRPLWAGRIVAIVAILLLALNLRSAVAALSPIAALVAEDVPLDALALGVLGMLAPVAFALFVMLAGPLLRASAENSAVLFAGTALTFVGMGVGNVLLPPAVKRYFPDRIGVLTSAYATLLAVSTAIPPAIAVPLAEATSWRVSLAIWGLLALAAMVPWLVLWARRRTASTTAEAEPGRGSGGPQPQPRRPPRLRSSAVAWAMVVIFGVSSVHVYTAFAWLPQLLIEHAGVGAAAAGVMLGLYAIVGFPMSLVVPILAARMRSVGPLIYAGTLCYAFGYAGLLLAPEAATVLWVILAGAGGLIFPLTLVLINLRTRTPAGSVALSGFVQSLGYTAGAFGPLLVGLLREGTGNWHAPVAFLFITGLLPILGGVLLRRPGYVDDPRG